MFIEPTGRRRRRGIRRVVAAIFRRFAIIEQVASGLIASGEPK
jgi:hypothetical protein